MRHPTGGRGRCHPALLLLLALRPMAPARAQEAPRPVSTSSPERATLSDGRVVAGRLEGDAKAGFRFRPEQDGAPVPLETIIRIEADGRASEGAGGSAPFRVR